MDAPLPLVVSASFNRARACPFGQIVPTQDIPTLISGDLMFLSLYRALLLTRRLLVIYARCGPSFKGSIETAPTKTGPSSWRFSKNWTQDLLWNRQEFGDSSREMFARMYQRRRKGYVSIGYERVPPQIPVEVENNNATEPHRNSAISEG
jgi:hypothetical protein